jgi:hypothetical protein
VGTRSASVLGLSNNEFGVLRSAVREYFNTDGDSALPDADPDPLSIADPDPFSIPLSVPAPILPTLSAPLSLPVPAVPATINVPIPAPVPVPFPMELLDDE